MRVYKFRAWDNEHKMMIDTTNLVVNALGGIYLQTAFEQPERQFNLILMQYTGLKDKQGKEIYEGDLIRVLERDWGSMHLTDFKGTIEEYMKSISSISEVVWDDGRFRLIQRNKGNYHSEYVGYNERRDIFEIIGNIYEQPSIKI